MIARDIRVEGDVSHLPTSASGPASLAWWGNFGFMAIEGTAFVLAAGSYLYLMVESPAWPPPGAVPPPLLWGVIFTIGLLMSEIPNWWLIRKAKAKDETGVRIGVVIMTLCGLLLMGARAMEIATQPVAWNENAYGSVLWLLLILHTTHLLTDWGDTVVLGLWLHTHEVGDRQFADVEDNALYWRFVEICWIPIYALIYWTPRL